MKHLPQAVAAMTPFPYAVNQDATVSEAIALLAAHDFHHLPVKEHGRVSGIVTAQDLATIPPQWRVRYRAAGSGRELGNARQRLADADVGLREDRAARQIQLDDVSGEEVRRIDVARGRCRHRRPAELR